MVSHNIQMFETHWRVKMISKIVLIDQGAEEKHLSSSLPEEQVSILLLALGKA